MTTMNGMFYECTSFNQSLGAWNVSQVNDMNRMSSGCLRRNAHRFR